MTRRFGIAALTLVAGLAISSTTLAHSAYVAQWKTIYPTSTLPARMASTLGRDCYVCHQSEGTSVLGTCYLMDIKARLNAGRTVPQAIADVDQFDSDGDGTSNHDEIVAVRTDLPGQVGYHPGRTGPTGLTCGSGTVTTGVAETPPSVCSGDTNGDRLVNGADISVLLSTFGSAVVPGSGADFNSDGLVNGSDLSVLLASFGTSC